MWIKLIFSVKGFAKSRFETEVKGNSEMPGLLMVSLRGHVTTKSSWIADTTFFWLQKWIQRGHISQVANVWSSHNFGEVVAIQKFQYFQN